jgi:acyl-CoA reductase-like NAD-dependent aldehyde dehydrogenase
MSTANPADDLAATVRNRDHARALRIARRLDAGAANINDKENSR